MARREPLIPIDPQARKGRPPCGECSLRAGETCDVCGASEKAKPGDVETVKLDEYVPNYNRRCSTCGQGPTVEGLKGGQRVVIADLCGPCTFGTADALDPSDWNRLG